MTDFSVRTAPRKNMDNNSGDAPSKIIINGEEFDATEASDLIGVGRQTRELETKYNTKLDRVWPEYGRVTTENKTLVTERDEARASIAEYEAKLRAGNATQQDKADATAAAKTLDLNPDTIAKAGGITEDKLNAILEEREQRSQAVKQVLDQADTLEKELDGSDGRPKFNKRAVMAYASTYGLGLKEAYEDMHTDVLTSWKEAQVASEKKKGLKTLQPGGEKQPTTPKITNDNFRQALQEALQGGSE